jgi:hypothetical protein
VRIEDYDLKGATLSITVGTVSDVPWMLLLESFSFVYRTTARNQETPEAVVEQRAEHL